MKNKPPLVPWAVGHVGLVQKPVSSGLYLRRMPPCLFCGTPMEIGQECEVCAERWRNLRSADTKPKPQHPAR